MRLELTGRHIDITPGLRRLVERKLGKIERLLNDRAVSAHAVLSREKHRHRAEITLHARGEKFLHGVGDAVSWEPSVGQAIQRITQQAQKIKGKAQSRKGRSRAGEAIGNIEAAPSESRAVRARPKTPSILRKPRQKLTPMSVAVAARELAGDADGVLVFRDLDTAAFSVIYRRRNGELILVQAEA